MKTSLVDALRALPISPHSPLLSDAIFCLKISGHGNCLSPSGLLLQKYHSLGGWLKQHLFLMVQETRKSKIKMPADLVC